MLYAGLKGACESGGMAGRIEARHAGTERQPAPTPARRACVPTRARRRR
jgi:hypothetical protein